MLPQSCCPQNRHVRPFLLFHPLPSPLGDLGEIPSSPVSAPHFSAFLRHRGPLDAPQASYAQGSGPSCVDGVREGEEIVFSSTRSLPSPSPASPAPSRFPGPAGLLLLGPWQSLPSSWIPFSQMSKHLQLPAPSALVLKCFPSGSPPEQIRPLQVAGSRLSRQRAWPQTHPE